MSAPVRNAKPADGGLSIEEAYARCEEITRVAAANFYYGIRLLAPEKRNAMSAVYAFARRVDDIGDGSLDADEKLARLQIVADELVELGRDGSVARANGSNGNADANGSDSSESRGDPVMIALADAARRFALPRDALEELVAGVRMDVTGSTYESFDQLLLYCRRVAGGIGRLCLAIFGARDIERAIALADDLGVAMQLTNIIRDVREDAENGRVYLPGEDLSRYNLARCRAPEQLAALARISVDATPAVVAGDGGGDVGELFALLRFEAQRAKQWFAVGPEFVALLDRRSSACVLAMTGIYRDLLGRIEKHPERSLRRRMSLSPGAKAWVAVRALAGPRG